MSGEGEAGGDTVKSAVSPIADLHKERCDQHPSEHLDLYCITCREATCRDCVAYDRQHTLPPCHYQPLPEAARTARDGLRSLARCLEDKKAEVVEAGERIGTLRATVDDVRVKYETDLTGFYDSLISSLEKRRESMVQLVHKGRDSLVHEMEIWQGEMEELLSKIKVTQERIEGLTDREVLSLSDSLHLEVADVSLRAIPVAATHSVVLETASVDAVMERLAADLPSYRAVDPNQSLVSVGKVAQVGTMSHVYITLRDSAGFPCSTEQEVSVTIAPPTASAGFPPLNSMVTPLSPSRYLACFTPTLETRGQRKVIVEIKQQRIDNDSVSLLVECPPQLLQNPIRTIENINDRGSLKASGSHVICYTKSKSGIPIIVFLDGSTNRTAFRIKLPKDTPLTGWAPDEIAVGCNLLYVGDTLNHMIHAFNLTDGTYVSSIGSEGSRRTQFNRPNGLCFAKDNRLYVCDSDNHRVQVLNDKLGFCFTFGQMGTGKGCFLWPSNITSVQSEDGTVQLYVSELHNHRVQCVTTRGKHIRFIGGQGGTDSQLSRPNILHVHRSQLYVSDDRGVVVFTLEGEFVTRFAMDLCKVGDYPIEGLTVSSDGYVYVYHCPQSKIFIY